MAANDGRVSSSLEGSPINLKLLREVAAQDLKRIITEADPEGKGKILVLDPTLAGPLGQIVDITWLKKLGIDKMYYLADNPLPSDTKNVIYLIRPKVKWSRYIAEHIKGLPESVKFNIYFVPMRRLLCEMVLQEEGVLRDLVKIGEYHLYLIPYDSDILSMDLTLLKECSIEGDRTSLFYVAKALMQIQYAFGIIPNIYGKGQNSQLVVEMMYRMRQERANEDPIFGPDIDTLVLLDREADLITPLATQLTYEGLLDEVFGIFNATVDLPATMVIDPKKAQENKEPIPTGKIKTPLNSNDKLFQLLRDLNFTVIGKHLTEKAIEIEEFYKSRKALNPDQLLVFMKQLPIFQAQHAILRIHTNITEESLKITREPFFRTRLEAEQNLLSLSDLDSPMSFITSAIALAEPVVKVLRLICLYSLTNNGIPDKFLNNLKRDIVHTYGYKYLFTLQNLTKLGMIKPFDRANPYFKLKKDLNLIIEEMDEHVPTDIAYVYSGYAPISIRLVEKLLPLVSAQNNKEEGEVKEKAGKEKPWISGWGSPELDSVLRECLGGSHFRVHQAPPKGLSQYRAPTDGKKVIMVFFLGGCTFTELSAIRFLNARSQEFKFIVATTQMINGNTLIEGLIEKFE